jgi:DNA-binding beta-propeller fold protein YncE
MTPAARAKLRYAAMLTLALCLPAANAAGSAFFLHVPGNPFMALPSADGSTLFVSVQMPGGQPNALYVFRRSGPRFTQAEAIRLQGVPAGLALTPDGKTLVVADGTYYAALPTGSIGGSSPAVAYLDAGGDSGVIEAVTSLDGNYAFFSNETRATIDVVRLHPQLSLVGSIGVERGPVGVALSPDGRYLYATSELSSAGIGMCDGRPAGRLSAIDAALAETGSHRALIASALAGCEPVRVAAWANGQVLWVTVRGANRLAAFDAEKLRTTPSKALIASLEVGEAPVGLLASADGKHVVVANSNRFNPNATSSTLTVVDAKAVLSGVRVQTLTLGTGPFPREITESTANGEIYVTNFAGGTVEIIPAAMLSPAR